MTRIKRLDDLNSDHPEEWSLFDEASGAKYRERPFENYSVAPSHEIKLGNILHIFGVYRLFDKEKEEPSLAFYSIQDFAARDYDTEQDWIRRKALRQTFETTYPILKEFLTFIHSTHEVEKKVQIETKLRDEIFWNLEEEQQEKFTSFITSARNIILILLNYDSYVEKFKGTIMFLEPEELSINNQMKELEDDFLKPNAPLKKIRRKLYDQYLSEGVSLPEEDVYLKTYVNMLRPYLQTAS